MSLVTDQNLFIFNLFFLTLKFYFKTVSFRILNATRMKRVLIPAYVNDADDYH